MNIIRKIRSFNKKLEIKTFFYKKDDGTLGYNEDGKIYLNKYYMDYIEVANKHEILHLHINNKNYKLIKEII